MLTKARNNQPQTQSIHISHDKPAIIFFHTLKQCDSLSTNNLCYGFLISRGFISTTSGGLRREKPDRQALKVGAGRQRFLTAPAGGSENWVVRRSSGGGGGIYASAMAIAGWWAYAF
ncbi:hypothetical protein Salat_1339100 [Sesamum alatum]|uniref:Uncharacterized protein n=1 Tax=Sesamum alatum TaxID=300844 RepID=A0AAE2CQG0_9LAMI|nr:hypothetical protein Salat_1339100 [Sesamum alatum]